MGRLDGKIAIITGAASGMGRAHAERFAREGAKVAVTDINAKDGAAVASKIGASARFFIHDVTSAASWDKVISAVETSFGPANVLVNNAGISSLVHLDELSEVEYRKVFDVNQLSVFLGMKAVSPSMRRAGGGSIINISSTCGILAVPCTVAYTATKFAVRGMSKAAALDLAKDKIRVNSVHPGLTRTPMLDPNIERDFTKRVPLARVSDADEVSSIVVYLASDDSSYSTGAEFVVDGGLTAHH